MGTLRLTAITSDDMAKMPWDDGSNKLINVHSKPHGDRYTAPRWRREAVPPPPDYSTPQAVTARCREGIAHYIGTSPMCDEGAQRAWLKSSWAAEKDQTVAKAYRAFIRACGDWRDQTPHAPHQPGVGKKWTAERDGEALAEAKTQR